LVKKSKFFKKIFYSYMAIFTILILIVEVAVCGNIVSNQQKQSKELAGFVEKSCLSMDNKLLSIMQVAKMLSENSEVEAFAQRSYEAYTGEDYLSVLKLRDMISDYLVTYLNYDCDIAFFRAGDKWIVDDWSTYSIVDYLARRGIDVQSFNQCMEESKTTSTNTLALFGNELNEEFITFLSWHKYSSGKYIYFLIDFDKTFFFPQSGAVPGDFFAAVDKTEEKTCVNRIIEEVDDSKLIKNIKKQAISIQPNVHVEDGYFTIHSTVVPDMLYTYYHPGTYTGHHYAINTILLLLLWLVLMLLGYYISRYMARKIYGPVNNIFSILNAAHAKNFDDITSLSDSVVDLVNDNKRLRELAEKNQIFIKGSFLKDLITGNVTKQQILSGFHEYHLEHIQNPCLCVVCEYDNMGNDNIIDYQKIQVLKSAFMGRVEEHFTFQRVCELVNIDHRHFAIIIEEIEAQTLNQALVRVVNEAEEMYNISPTMAVGKTVSRLADISNSYMSAMNLLEYKRAIGDKRVICENDLGTQGEMNYYYPVEVEKNLIYYVLEGQLDKCEDILTDIFTVNFTEHSLNLHNVKDFKFSLTATIKRILKQIDKTVEDVFGEDVIIYLELNSVSDPVEMEKLVRDIMREIIQYIQENSENKKHKVTQNILDYVDRNYGRDLALSEVAEHFCLSEGYISNLLKNDFNVGFKQYLNERRVQAAKELLLSERNLPIGDIATMVGCNSVVTFIRMFKKHTGMSPGEYRKTQC